MQRPYLARSSALAGGGETFWWFAERLALRCGKAASLSVRFFISGRITRLRRGRQTLSIFMQWRLYLAVVPVLYGILLRVLQPGLVTAGRYCRFAY